MYFMLHFFLFQFAETGCMILQFEPFHGNSNNVVCATSKASDQPAHTRSLIRAVARRFEYSMSVKLLTEHYFEFLRLKGGCTGLSESTLVKIPHCWKSHALAHYCKQYIDDVGIFTATPLNNMYFMLHFFLVSVC